MGILYDDFVKLDVAGVREIKDINFLMEVTKGHYYTPLMFAAVKGSSDAIKILVENQSIDINLRDRKTGVNAFWLAAFYGRGNCLRILAEAGSDIMVKHKISGANAVHIAILRGHFNIVK